MADLAQVIKKAAVDAVKASYPVEVVYGSVVTAEPLAVKIGQQLTVEKSFVNLSDGIRTSIASGKITTGDRIILIKHQGGQRFTAIDAFHNEEWEPELFKETDPTVPPWAKASQKPQYTAAETGAAPAGYGPGERLWDNMIKNPLDVSLKTGVYGMWDGLEGFQNYPETNFVGYCEVYSFNPEWRCVVAHNLTDGRNFWNYYKSDYVWHGWSNFPYASPEEKYVFGQHITSNDSVIGHLGKLTLLNTGYKKWLVRSEGEYTRYSEDLSYYHFGFYLPYISQVIGKQVSFSGEDKLKSSWRIVGNTGAELRELYGYGTCFENIENTYLLPARIYTSGQSIGGWGIGSLPASGFISAELYLTEV